MTSEQLLNALIDVTYKVGHHDGYRDSGCQNVYLYRDEIIDTQAELKRQVLAKMQANISVYTVDQMLKYADYQRNGYHDCKVYVQA